METKNLRIDFGVSERAFVIISLLIASVFLFTLYHLVKKPESGTMFRFALIVVLSIFNLTQTLPRRKNFIEWTDDMISYKILRRSGSIPMTDIKSIEQKEAIITIGLKDGSEHVIIVDQATSPRQKETIKRRFGALAKRFPVRR